LEINKCSRSYRKNKRNIDCKNNDNTNEFPVLF